MSLILCWLRRLSASDTAVRAVEEALLDWKHEVAEAPGVIGAFASDFRMAAGIGRLIVGVVFQDVGDAMRRPWVSQLLAWMLPIMLAEALVTMTLLRAGLATPGTRIWWWALAGASLPYAGFLVIARADRQPPALGLFLVTSVLWFADLAVYNAVQPLPRVWFIGLEWLLLPAACTLLADRVRREVQRARALGVCFAVWVASRVLLATLLGTSGGIYDRWLVWIVPAAPAALWLFFVWKQERTTLAPEPEEAHA